MLTTAIALIVLAGPLVAGQESIDPEEVMAAFASVAHKDLWPGFDATAYPIAFFTGEKTVLFGYPGTPAGFSPTADGEMLIYPGRHEMMQANTSTRLEGVPLATVILPGMADMSATEVAALTVHELFHVYQREHHPDWSANEASLFSYPFSDVDIYRLRRLESAAMKLSLSAQSGVERDAWAMRALRLRLERYRRMDDAHVVYERDQELNEGLAQYVEDRASGRSPRERFPAVGWNPEQIRNRAYTTGQFFATLLDEHLPGWKQLYNDGMSAALDTALLIALARAGAEAAVLPDDLVAEETGAANGGVAAYLRTLDESEREFQATPGWKVRILVAEGADLLALQGFDPLNVLNLGEGKVLHNRMLMLGSDRVNFRLVDGKAVSYGPNRHPLFHGVRWVTAGALADKPLLESDNGTTSIKAEGLDITVHNAEITVDDELRQIDVKIPPGN